MARIMTQLGSLLIAVGMRVERTIEAIYDREMSAIEHHQQPDRHPALPGPALDRER